MDERTRRINEHVLQTLPNVGGNPERRRVLALNEELRKLDRLDGVPDDWGYVALNIPVGDMRVLQVRYPELASLDYETQFRAWKKFLASPESAPYKLRRNDGKKGLQRPAGVIVR
jgi:hypothetical protein